MGAYAWERRSTEFLEANARFKRHVLRELDRNGPLLSRELADHSQDRREEAHPWWGTRNVSLMLEILNARGFVAIAGRRNEHRLWDLAERWYPDVDNVRLRDANRILAEKRFRALGAVRADYLLPERATSSPSGRTSRGGSGSRRAPPRGRDRG